jgi:hypothetical protein
VRADRRDRKSRLPPAAVISVTSALLPGFWSKFSICALSAPSSPRST